MPATYTLISSNVLTSSAASVTFSAIPATYTDLVLRMSVRSDRANNKDEWRMSINADSSALYSDTYVYGVASTASSGRASAATAVRDGGMDAANNTANTFSSLELYIPSYTASKSKAFSYFGVTENNATTNNEIDMFAYLYRSSTAISSLALTSSTSSNFVSGSSFYLYGISNA
jgi:hypothetical protein